MGKRDALKPLAELLKADVRNTWYVRIDEQTGEQHPVILQDHYTEIERYALHDNVPDDIAIQYDVARNLYVYAWFEYRFFNVAQANALTVLELAMKMRIGDDEIWRYIKQRQKDHLKSTSKKLYLRPNMKTLMEYCRDHKLIANEGFSQWRLHATQQAYSKAEFERFEWAVTEMEKVGTGQIELTDINIEQLLPDPTYDHVQHLVDHTNKFRNMYAHGSTMLHNQVLHSFEMVSEFINQLYFSHS